MRADLHMHSCYSSDGEFSPSELIAIAQDSNLDVVTLSDHESNQGVMEMLAAGEKAGIKVIPGIELNADINGDIAHILGLGIDPQSTRFTNYLDDFQKMENNISERLIKMFQKHFAMDFDYQEMLARCQAATWNLIPLVDELIHNPRYKNREEIKPYLPGGAKSDFPAGSFYWDFCSKGQPFYIPLDIHSYSFIIEEIHKDGGIAILAHPYNLFYERYDYLENMQAAGLDGIEAFSNYHDDKQNLWYYNYCKAHNLLVSGGSDFHGSYKPAVKMGEFGCENQEEVLAEILDVLLKN